MFTSFTRPAHQGSVGIFQLSHENLNVAAKGSGSRTQIHLTHTQDPGPNYGSE